MPPPPSGRYPAAQSKTKQSEPIGSASKSVSTSGVSPNSAFDTGVSTSRRYVTPTFRPAHTIKSTSHRMGAMELSLIAMEIETEARLAGETAEAVPFEDFARQVERLAHIFDKTKDAIGKAVRF